MRRSDFNTSASGGAALTGIFQARVVAVDEDSTLRIKIPKIGLDNIYEGVLFSGPEPDVGDLVYVGFLEGKAGSFVAFTGGEGTAIELSDNPPPDPDIGDLWFETATGKTFLYYDSYWVEVGSSIKAFGILSDTDSDTSINVEQFADDDTIRFKTAGTERLTINSSGHLLPSANETYDLGSALYRFRDLYLSGTSINLGGASITSNGTNITVSGTFEGRDLASDGTKLDGITAGANVTDAATVEAAIESILLTSVAGDTGDELLIVDATDGGLKAVLWETLPGVGAGLNNVVEDTTPQLGGALDVNGQEITGAIDLHSTGDVITELGDAAGVNKLSVRDSAAIEVASIDSDGNLALSGSVDGRDIAADGSKLDGIETGADVTDATNVETAIEAITLTSVSGATGDEILVVDATDGGLKAVLWENLPAAPVDSVNSQTGAVVLDADDISDAVTTNKFTTAAEITKLAGIETGADVTDATNVETAIEAITLTSVSGATGDEILVVDATDGGLKAVFWENLPSAPVDSVNSQTGAVVLDADDISDTSTTNKFTTAANLTKLGHITVTQAVDLDAIETRVNQLDAVVVLQGSWDASAGSFPGSGSAQAGDSYIVSVAGTVDSVAFSVNDRLLAIVDNASTSTYASNWLKLDYTDQVLSVNTQTGAVVLDADDISDTSTTNKFTTAADISKLAGIETGATADQTAADIRSLGFFDTTNDGTGSGLDADLLDGNHATAFATASQGSTADSALQNVVEDTTPQLGGALDVNGQEITGAIDLHSTGDVITELGDAAGVNKLSVRDSAAAEVAAFDSDGNLTLAGTVDGRDVAADGTKLDGIESGAEVNAVDSVNSQTGVVVLDADDISDASTTNKFTTAADITKLAGIETGATADQTAADIRGLGFFDTSNDGTGSGLDADLLDGNHATAFATAAQGSTADSALQNVVEDTTPQLGGALDVNGQEITGAIDLHSTGDIITELGDAAGANKLSIRDSAAVEVAAFDSDGNLTLSGTVDGRDVATDGTKLDGIAAGAEVNAVDSVNSQTGVVVLDADDISDAATTNKFTTAADITKLAGIETGADVTDAANVETSIEAITLTSVAGATGDELLIVDATDGGLKAVLWENLPGSGGGISNVVEDTTPQLGGALDVNGQEITGAIDLHSTGDIINELGDAAGANKLAIRDSAAVEVAAFDSDGNLTLSGTVDGRDVAADGTKLDGIAAGAEVNAVDSVNSQTGAVVLDADDISDAATTNKFTTAANLTKLGHITVTQAVDLDTIESRVNQLDAAVVLQGSWDASGGSFPGSGSAQAGDSYIVSVAGTVDSVAFSVNDRLLAIVDNASTTTYASNWLKLDYTDQVLSVNTQTGAVVLDADDISDTSTTNKFTTAADITKLAGIETGADVTDAANVETSIEAITLTAVAGATGDEVLIVDATDGGLKAVLWENLPGGGGISNVVEDTTPQLGGALDVNGQEITGAIDLHSTGDVIIELGDAAGTNKLSIRDSGAVEQFLVDSDGNVGVGKTPNAGSRLDVNGRIEAYQNTLQTNNDDYAFITSGNFGGGYGFYEGTNRAVIVAPGGNQMEFFVGGSPTSWGTMAIDIDASGNVKFPVSIQDSTGRDISDAVTSTDVTDIVEISQASYTALGAGRPANRLYLITS